MNERTHRMALSQPNVLKTLIAKRLGDNWQKKRRKVMHLPSLPLTGFPPFLDHTRWRRQRHRHVRKLAVRRYLVIGIWSRARGTRTPTAVALRWLFSFERVSSPGEWSLRFFKRCVGYFRQIDNPSMVPVCTIVPKTPRELFA
jgi:hypothetical protein